MTDIVIEDIAEQKHSEENIQPMIKIAEPEIIVNNLSAGREKQTRNYSFLHKNPESLDEVVKNGIKFVVPAAIGSRFWAILKVCYEHADEIVYPDDLLKEVEIIMTDRDPDEWAKYCSKEKTTVYKKLQNIRDVQKISSWQERIINNAKTLTRKDDYGQRLIERGHVLRFTCDKDKKPCFILHTSLAILEEIKKK